MSIRSFIADAQKSTPQNIVARYGTHVLSNIVLGGKISFLYRSETKNTDRIKAAMAGINMPLAKIFGITADINTDSKESLKNYSQSINYKTVGGDPTISLIGQIPIGKDLPVINVTSWQSSVTIENSQLIDIRSNGLIPIYELIPDAGKRSLVKAYVEKYILNSQISSSPEPIINFTIAQVIIIPPRIWMQ
ncbi:MAC/perforin domain-containing protein [Pedobacter sp. NJ-S-72]